MSQQKQQQAWWVTFVRGLIKFWAKRWYRIEVRGLEHYHQRPQDRPLLIVANHVSLLDGPLIDGFIPGSTTFMIDAAHTQGWFRSILLRLGRYITTDLHSPMAAKHLIKALEAGEQVMIFPEGRISTQGGLMKIYSGAGLVADKTGAAVLAVHIEGAQWSHASYLDGRVRWLRRSRRPKITLTLSPAEPLAIDPQLRGRARHQAYQKAMLQRLQASHFQASWQPGSLWQAFDQAVTNQWSTGRWQGVDDALGTKLSYKKARLGARVLGSKLAQLCPESNIGVMLPNSAGVLVTFWALQSQAKLPAMLNFTAGEAALISACKTAQLQRVLTSRRFIKLAGLQAIEQALAAHIEWIYLEDVRETISLVDKLSALARPSRSLPGYQQAADHPAVILFTSGSEAAPKAVLLSHQNLLANIAQVGSQFALLPGDGVFNALPTFHSFGLTAGLLWPVLAGAKLTLYPSPLHYHQIPEAVYQSNARVFFATDTFYKGYARRADPYDFNQVEVLVAGAEPLSAQTRELYAQKFGKTILEGYGVTEASPVVAVNTPQARQDGSVGRLLPGLVYRLEPVEGLSEGGRLWIKGPNVMLGYWFETAAGELVAPPDGWYDTGDLARIDAQGFIWLLGRAKRFAKIAGEMVSLVAIEQAIAPILAPDKLGVAVRVSDSKKGEKIVLVSNDAHLSLGQVQQVLAQAGMNELAWPKLIYWREQIPLLGSGKIAYQQLDQWVAEQ
ncbi:AMP-binding protein [Thiomicrospira cyclica]|uniref:Acyl-(Acyl-carrier-protein)--phospholipid O-acyltransferase n=1 Tax=Thiomicrospira cyclica (strain DSM 14477 / JCM 11371 / ALM1) TaxID=717773 RepID=F6DBJ0_THICA|nr:AMP-binding protein [Thiomicrospira cyclica]AEG32392.1 Acyl-(acyl-carrier-protein)--phospholipid O-acyltransferase [Thiomicrospira cyclica ALM1]